MIGSKREANGHEISLYSMRRYHQNVVTYAVSIDLEVIAVNVLMFCPLFWMSWDSSISVTIVVLYGGSTVLDELIVSVSLLQYSGYSIVRREMKGSIGFCKIALLLSSRYLFMRISVMLCMIFFHTLHEDCSLSLFVILTFNLHWCLQIVVMILKK